jgi:hypothetical protein
MKLIREIIVNSLIIYYVLEIQIKQSRDEFEL